ncbi:MAG: hypothetical protein AB2L14_33090 [Candidatus Xenobiia bacterium LiM19]
MADTNIKKELFVLINRLPDEEALAVKRFTEFVLERLEKEAQVLTTIKAFDEAPECDEDLTDEDLRDIEKAKEEIRAGRVTSWNQFQEELL